MTIEGIETSSVDKSKAPSKLLSQLDYQSLLPNDETIAELRREIYHSQGLGYVVLPSFISPTLVEHMRQVWSGLPEEHMHEKFRGWSKLYAGTPNFELRGKPRDTFVNFFWNTPVCDATHAVSLMVVMLRNLVEGKPLGIHLNGENDIAHTYRVVVTRNAEISNPWHTDWIEENTFDLSRIQATLYLSNHGDDYEGQGFVFRDNTGRVASPGKDLNVKAGDLVLWRYRNEHSVMEVSSDDDQLGFARIIYTPELLYRVPKDKQPVNGTLGQAPVKLSGIRTMTPKERSDLEREILEEKLRQLDQ